MTTDCAGALAALPGVKVEKSLDPKELSSALAQMILSPNTNYEVAAMLRLRTPRAFFERIAL